MVSAVITGAGLSSRMIQDMKNQDLPIKNKLTLPLIKDKTILEVTINNVLNSGIDECILVLGHCKDEIIQSLSEEYTSKLKIVINNPVNVGLSSSLFNGLNNLDTKNLKDDYVLCVSADQPTITRKTYRNIIKSLLNSENPDKTISFLRRREIGILDSPLGLGMPFVVSKKLILPYIKDENTNLNPILRKIFTGDVKFIAVKERFDLELININHYNEYIDVLDNINKNEY